MRKDTYRIGDGTFAFSPAVFDSLLGHGAKGAARMRELAGAMHVSISSIKDWRRGTHAPSDFEKVEDIACWAHIDVADLLIESGDRTMDEKLTENQLDVLCVLWNQAYDFLDLCEETDHFVWPTTDLRCVPDSILHDIKVNPEDDKSRPPWEVGTEDLFLQTLDVYLRACRRATPYVGESDIFVRLLGLCDIMTETAFGEGDGKWLPDPDMIFDPHEDGFVSPMEAARRADGKIIRDIAGHTEPVGSARCGGDIYSLYRVEGSAFGDFTCYRVGRAPYNGTLYLPAGFHDYGIATLRGLFAALEGGQCEFLCEYQDEIDGVYHGLFEKRI